MEPKGGRDGDRRRELAEGSTIISESAFCFTKLQRYQFFLKWPLVALQPAAAKLSVSVETMRMLSLRTLFCPLNPLLAVCAKKEVNIRE